MAGYRIRKRALLTTSNNVDLLNYLGDLECDHTGRDIQVLNKDLFTKDALGYSQRIEVITFKASRPLYDRIKKQFKDIIIGEIDYRDLYY